MLHVKFSQTMSELCHVLRWSEIIWNVLYSLLCDYRLPLLWHAVAWTKTWTKIAKHDQRPDSIAPHVEIQTSWAPQIGLCQGPVQQEYGRMIGNRYNISEKQHIYSILHSHNCLTFQAICLKKVEVLRCATGCELTRFQPILIATCQAR